MSTERLILESRLVKQLNGVIKKLNDKLKPIKKKRKKE